MDFLAEKRRLIMMRLVALPTNCLIVFDHFVGLALKGLKAFIMIDPIVLFILKYIGVFRTLCQT